MSKSIEDMVSEFRAHLTERGTIEVLGQVPCHGLTRPDPHANSVAAYRLGLKAGIEAAS